MLTGAWTPEAGIDAAQWSEGRISAAVVSRLILKDDLITLLGHVSLLTGISAFGEDYLGDIQTLAASLTLSLLRVSIKPYGPLDL